MLKTLPLALPARPVPTVSFAVRWGRLLALLALLLSGTGAWAQALTGTKTIPGTYASLAAAIADLNAQGVGTGGVTFNIAAGYAETFASPTAGRITVNSTAPAAGPTAPTSGTNPIVFQKAGTGANPVITGGTGTSTTSDAIISVVGTDNVSFVNIDVSDNSANTTAATQMEYGYALFRASATDGSQYVSVTGATITLNKSNTATVGIRSLGTDATGATLAATNATGTNSYAKLNGNTVANAFWGLYVSGTNATYPDAGDEIGSTVGNQLNNLGGVNTSVYGVRGDYQQNLKIENNTVTIPSGNTSTTVYGVATGVASATGIIGTVLLNNNTVTITTATTSSVFGVYQAGSSAVITSTVTNNKVQNSVLTGASGQVQYIQDATTATATSATITGNTVTNNSATTTGLVSGIYKTGGGTTVTISNNTITGNTKSSSGALLGTYLAVTVANLTLNGNTISSNQLTGSTANSTLAAVYYSMPTGTITSLTATGNVMNNNQLTVNNASYTGALYGLGLLPSAKPVITTETLNNNTFSGNKVTAAAGELIGLISSVYNSSTSYSIPGTLQANGNTLTNNAIVSTSGTLPSDMYGIYDDGLTNTLASLSNNTVAGFSITGTNTGTNVIYGIYSNTSAIPKTINQNTLGGLALGTSSAPLAGTVTGLLVGSGSTVSVAQNKVYDLSATGTSGGAYGIDVEGGTTVTVATNVVGNLTAPTSTASPAIIGLDLNAGTTLTAYFNTVYLSGTSSGTNFGAAGIAFSGTPTTLTLRNNLVVNNATATGTGVSTALGRLMAGTAGTVPASLSTASNNNLLYGAYLYAEGVTTSTVVNGKTTLFDYRNFMYLAPGAGNSSATRGQRTVSQNVSFASTTGTDPNFLQPSTGMPTPVESGALPISGITTDYAGTTRSTTTPDIGAYEGTYTYIDAVAPGITYTPLTNNASTTTRPFTSVSIVEVAPGSGVNTTSGTKPRVYYKISTDANLYNDNTSGTPGWKYVEASGSTSPFNFTIDYSLLPAAPVVGTVIQYFVVAQDGAATPTVAIDAGTFAAQPASVALTSAAFPIGGTLNQYAIVAPLPTAISVGTGQTYTSLTNTGGVFDAINNGLLAGNITVTVTSDLTGELGTVALGPLPDGGNNYTLTIQSDGTLRNITGTATNAAGLVRLAGASRVTFSGQQPSGSKNLLFGNTTANAPTFNLTADASNNTLQYLLVESANTSATSGAIVLGSGTNTGNNYNQCVVLDVRSTANATTATYANGIYSVGLSSTVPNGPDYLYYNNIHNFSNSGVFLDGSNNAGWVVAGNYLFQEAARTTALIPVQVAGGSNHTINQNNIYQTTGTVSNAFTGISLIGGGTGHTVSGNFIGGASGGAVGSPLTVTGATSGIVLAVGTSAPTSVQGNTIRAITNASTSYTITYGISVTTGAVNVGGTMGNVVGGAAAGQALTANYDLTGISVASAAASTISNNTVQNLLTGTAPGAGNYFTGIIVSGAAGHTIAGNTVAGVVNGSLPNNGGGYDAQTLGLFSAANGVVTVSGNQISNVGNTATTTAATYGHSVIGLGVQGASAGHQVVRNRVSNVYTSTTGTGAADFLVGIYASSNGGTVANNQVSLATATATAPALYGFYELSGGNTDAFNSVYLAGTGTSTTYAFYRANTGSITVRNNLLYNARTGGGSNYAIGTASTTNWMGASANPSTNTSDYNLFFASDATKVGLYGATGYSFAGWKTATGGDGSSLSEQASVVPAASLFTNTSTGDLSLQAGNSAAWYANGTGTQVATIGTDYVGTTRPTTVAAGAPDIGSTEVTPTAMPPALAATPAAPALGTIQAFALGGRTLALLAWGNTLAARPAGPLGRPAASALPSLVVGRYYSGTNPPAPFRAGAKYANVYFDFSDANADGSGYTYQPIITYDPALLGTIASETAQRLNQRLADNSGYTTYFSTTVSTAARTLTGPNTLNRLSILAISDAAAPLPVELTAFDAVRQASDALLSWTTATELDNKGFDVQVSPDGQSFRTLGFVAGAGSSQTAHRYTYLDQEAGKAGLRYYRLRQVDGSGTASYSPVRTVQFDAPTAMQVLAWPNPFAQVLHLTVALPQAVPTATLTLTDALGRQVLHQELGALPAGTSQPALSEVFGQLPAGFYVLRLATPTGTQMLKVVRN